MGTGPGNWALDAGGALGLQREGDLIAWDYDLDVVVGNKEKVSLVTGYGCGGRG